MSSAGKPHFLVGFDPSSSSERLKIPNRFTEHMEGMTCGTVSLIGPSGNIWHADLIQLPEGLFIHDGWAAFVGDHFLEDGDSLVLRYDGNLHFVVLVFDHSACEKEAAFSAECSQDQHLEKKRARESTFLLNNIVECVPKKLRTSQVPSEYVTKNMETSDSQRYLGREVVSVSERCLAAGLSSETMNCGSLVENAVTIAVLPRSKSFNELSDVSTKTGTSAEGDLGSYAAVCLSTTMSASEAERVAQSFSSCFPHFMKVMKRFNISGSYTLNIPYQFSMAHLPKCKVQIVLHNLKGESWTVNSIPTTRVQTSHTFCGGWLAFVRDNDINMGDICIFELVHKCELRVQVLRVGKEELNHQMGKEVFKGKRNGCFASSHKLSKQLPKKMKENSYKAHLQRLTKVGACDKKLSDCEESVLTKGSLKAACFSDRVKYGFGKSTISRKSSSQLKQGTQTKGCMSMKSAPEERIVAQSFVSSYPHFVRIMKMFNVSGSFTLKIPYQFSTEHLPDCKTEIVLRNLKGKYWIVNSIPTIKVQTLHTFCGGWMAFVRDNDIQFGDICIFELVGNCEMRVHIFGVGKKGLGCLNGKLTSNESTIDSLLNDRPLLGAT